MDAGLGVLPRVQFAITAPVTKVSYTDGTTTRGLGDVYLAVKLGLLDPAAEGRSFGIAVAPVVEFLSSGSVPEGGARVHWALPLALEKRFERWRAYGTVGYFSRGAIYGSAAGEVPLTEKLTATGVLSHLPLARGRPAERRPGPLAHPLGPERRRGVLLLTPGHALRQRGADGLARGRQRVVLHGGRGTVLRVPAPPERARSAGRALK